MKKINLIEWLWKTDSHEKQSPQRFRRYAVMLMMLLTLGVGQMWATFSSDGSTYFYFHKNQYAGSSKFDFSGSEAVLWLNIYGGTGGTRYYEASHIAGDWYGAKITNSGSYAKVIIIRKDPNNSHAHEGNYDGKWNQSNEISLGDNINCLNDGGSQGVYRPAVSSFTLTPSGFSNLGGSGTSESPYLVVCGATITFTVSSVSGTVNDDSNMTLNYDFKENDSSSKYKGSNNSYTYTASSTAYTSFNMKVYAYNNYQSGDGTSASRQIYFKTIKYYVSGKGTGNWCDGKSWNVSGSPMTYDASSGKWQITFDNVAASTDLQFAITDGTWNGANAGGPWKHDAYNSSCSTNVTETDGGGNNHNATLSISDPSNITITFTPSGSSNNICASAVALYNSLAVAINDANAATTPTISAEYTTSDAPVTVTAADANPGYTWSGWTANGGTFGNSSLQQTTWSPGASSKTATANYTENNYDVTITKTTGGTLSSEATVIGHKTTSANLPTATAYPGYRFVNWTVTTGTASITNANSASSATINNMTANVTVRANFERTYAYIEGRMTVYNAARTSETHTASSKGEWDESSTRIEMEYDETNHRFYRHTYKTPAELKAQISSKDQWFSVKTGTVHNSFASGTAKAYHPSSNTNIATAGTKYSAPTTATRYNFKFTNTATDGYAIIYFDEADVWYELEQSLKYDGNGNKGGSAPAGTVYYAKGTNATAASNTYTREGYTFTGWNTQNDGNGTSYAVGASVPMNSNITLYAQWSPNNWTVTLDPEGGTKAGGLTTAVSVTYDATTNLTSAVTVPATHAAFSTFGGYWTGRGGTGTQLIDASGNWIKDKTGYTGHSGANPTWVYNNNITLYAKWTLYYSLVHYPALTNTAESAGGVTVTYKSSTLTGFTASSRSGYTCQGYYTTTTAAGGGQKVITSGGVLYYNGVGDTIVDSSNKWIYATRRLNNENGGARLYPRWTANTYTITFNADDASRVGTATNVQATVSVTFNNNNYNVSSTPVTTVAVPVLDGYIFGGYWTVANGAGTQIVDAEGNWLSSKTYYTDASGNWIKADNVTLYAKWTAKTYTLTFDAGTNGGHMLGEAGDPATKDVTVTYGANYSVTGRTGYRVGYEFTGWFTAPTGGTQVTNDTRITTHSNHTIYAQYRERNYVYFYNNLGWSKVFVTYNAYWADGDGGTGNHARVYHEMQLVDGTTNIYRDEIPSAIIDSWSGTNAWIAFNDTQLDGGSGVPTSSGKYNNYNSGKVIHRRDFDSYATMFVPNASATVDFTKMSGGASYYCTGLTADDSDKDYRYIDKGYWTRYDDKESGYVLKGSWDGDHDYYFTRSYTEHADTTSVVLHLNASTDYTFKLYKHCRTSNHNNSWFSASTKPFTITSSNHTNIVFNSNWAGEHNGADADVTITTATEGDYTFKLACDKSTGVLTLTVDYPRALEDKDHRLVYTWNDGSSHTWISPNKIIPVTARTPMSAFIHKPANVTSNSLKLQRWNTSTSAWVDAYTFTLTDELIPNNGVYYIEPNRDKGTIIDVKVEPYTGKYYLRTDATSGGWKNYSNPSFGNNSMTYSAYSMTQTVSDPYSHYYCIYVDNVNTSVAYTIATEWTPSITDTLKTDDLVPGANCHLPEAANVRFMWNNETNELQRAYLKSAQGDNARFLVLAGKADDMIFKSNGDAIAAASPLKKNEIQFVDKGDWIYEIDLQAKPGALACITAKFDEADRYLIGNGTDKWETVLGGSGTTKYPMKGIYDFKTNRLMMMWTPPTTEINDNLKDVDMLWLRHGNNSASQINIGATGSLTDVTVVAALEFQYDELIGKVSSWTDYSRPLMKFMVSFPFDVNVSDIFGLNGAEYGREYVVQTYNGARRAEKGYYSLDGDYWEDLTVDSVMHANQGYSVIMDNVYLNNASSSIWEHKTSGNSIYLYFPAKTKITIPKSSGTSTVTPHLSFDKAFAGGTKNHLNTDSHWNMIGSPLFHDSYVSSTTNAESNELAAYYEWDSRDNTWGVEVESLIDPKDLDGDACFRAMSSYIVQWYGTINWSTTATDYSPAAAPRRANEEVKNYLARLELIYNDNVMDKAYVQLNENALKGYSLCEDLNKIMNGNKSNIYLFADNYEVAYSQVPVQTDTIPVGLMIRRDGMYTFSMPTNFSGTITLIDTYAGTRTNLALEDYEVELSRGTINDRFLLEINIHNAPTAIDGVTDGSGTLKDGQAHKFIMNGMMYILKDGVLYDARGNRVK